MFYNFGFSFEMRGMTRSSLLVFFCSATAISIAPAAAAAQTMEPVIDSMRLVAVYLINNPLLFLSLFLTAVLVLGKTLDLIRAFRDRRQRPIEGLKDEAQPISERLRTLSGRQD